MSKRNECISFLISHNYIWDGEIVARSFYECCAKIWLISFSTPEEKLKLVEEFWGGVRDIGDRKRAAKAKIAAELFGDETESKEILSFLSDERYFNIHSKLNKAERKKIEQRWSFSEIISHLDKMSDTGIPAGGVSGLLHVYGMASHLIHCDQAALDFMHDRITREPEERIHLENAHLVRIMSDQVSLTLYCAEAIRWNFDAKFLNGEALLDKFKEFHDLAEPYHDKFYATQRGFYESMNS